MASLVRIETKIYTGDIISVRTDLLGEVNQHNHVVATNPTSAKAHDEFAKILYAVNKQKAAEEYLIAGKLHEKQRQYKDAYRCYKMSIISQRDFLESIVLFAYLCKTLGFHREAVKNFKKAGSITFSGEKFHEAICYYDEALQLEPQRIELMRGKARCIVLAAHPLDQNERVKKAVAVLYPLLDTLQGKNKAKIFYDIGFYYRQVDLLLAKKNFLDGLWCALDDFDYELAEKNCSELKKLEYSPTVKVIDLFLQSVANHDSVPIQEKIIRCDNLLALRGVPEAFRRKASFLTGTPKKVNIKTYNLYLNLLPKDHSQRKRLFLVNSTGEAGHPNENDSLKNIISNAVEKKIPWGQLDEFVYTELSKVKAFNYRYFFRYTLPYTNITAIGESDHVLFFSLFNLDIRAFQKLLNRSEESLLALRDSNGNTLLHIAACFGRHEYVKTILIDADANGELTELINSRNQDGTNPLGMVFLDDTLPLEKVVKVAQLFIMEPSFKINSYLNNGIGMDFGSGNFLKKIGGLTCLHVALMRGLVQVLDLLQSRNISRSVSAHPNDFVNMTFPSLNPNRHMNSPNRFISSDAPNKANLEKFLAERKAEIEQADLDDSSGDSDDEDAPAFCHKKVLQDLASLVTTVAASVSPPKLDRLNRNPTNEPISLEEQAMLEEEQAKLAVVHFHGVPFMKGHYTHVQRRFVGRKIEVINRPLTQPSVEQDKKIERLKAIHSRTSTASAGFQTLYDVMTASDEQLKKVKVIDKQLRTALAQVWMEDPEKFIASLKKYIYDFSDNPLAQFWKNIPRLSNIIRYRFPICSLSKAPDHAVRFAAGKFVETQSLGEERMEPIYNNKGKPRHRLVGLLYITFHSISEMHQLQDQGALADTALLRCSDQMSTSQSRTDNQLEVSFFGGVSGKNVKVIIPIIYPNLSKGFKAGYHDVIWELTPNKISSRILDFESLLHIFTNFALKIVKALASKEGRIACYIDLNNVPQLFPTDPKTNKAKLSKSQLQISEGTVTKSGVTKDQLIQNTPEQLSQPTASKQLSSSSSLERESKARAQKEKDLEEVKRSFDFSNNNNK